MQGSWWFESGEGSQERLMFHGMLWTYRSSSTVSLPCLNDVTRTILLLSSRLDAAWPVALRHNLAMLRHEPAWWFEYSINCGVTVEFAWSFWTNVNNWALDADVESVEIDGPFVAGARGVTNSKSSGRIEWQIVEAQAGRAVIEFPRGRRISK